MIYFKKHFRDNPFLNVSYNWTWSVYKYKRMSRWRERTVEVETDVPNRKS